MSGIMSGVGGRTQFIIDQADVTSVPASTSSVQLLAAGSNRAAVYIENASTATLYLKYGTGASATSRTVGIKPGGFYEFPADPLYCGVVHGAWSAANGQANVTVTL